MAFGVDTVSTLTTIDWPTFYGWKKEWPSWVGRYFGGDASSIAGEFTYVLQHTSSVCKHVLPIQGATSSQLQDAANGGYNLGVEDANATIVNINKFLSTNELAINPAANSVYVYLDVEKVNKSGVVTVTQAYWAGWADTIYNAKTDSGLQPYFPCIYSQFVPESGLYVLNASVADTLNGVHASFPNAAARCYGLWSPQPFFFSQCDSSFPADWTGVFGSVNQAWGATTYPVPVYAWQYAEPGGPNGCWANTYPGFAGKQNLDMDSSDSTGAETFMLSIQAKS